MPLMNPTEKRHSECTSFQFLPEQQPLSLMPNVILQAFVLFLNSITLQHAINQIAEGTPVITTTREAVLVNKQDVLLETCVEMGLKAELADDWVVVAVDVSVDTVHAFEDLAHKSGERLGERDA